MANRYADWLRQAQADLRHAGHALQAGDYEPKPSSPSVVIKSVNCAQVEQAVANYVAALREAHPEIERAIWFGSWVTGQPGPGSDVDLCLIVGASDKPARERTAALLPVGFPVGIDLFVYTRAEWERLSETHPSWYAAIIAGRDV